LYKHCGKRYVWQILNHIKNFVLCHRFIYYSFYVHRIHCERVAEFGLKNQRSYYDNECTLARVTTNTNVKSHITEIDRHHMIVIIFVILCRHRFFIARAQVSSLEEERKESHNYDSEHGLKSSCSHTRARSWHESRARSPWTKIVEMERKLSFIYSVNIRTFVTIYNAGHDKTRFNPRSKINFRSVNLLIIMALNFRIIVLL